MDHFSYRNRILHCDETAIPALVEKYGTPLYVYRMQSIELRDPHQIVTEVE